MRDGRVVDAESFSGLDLHGRAVLVRTGWDRNWGTPSYGEGHPFLARAAAERLVEMAPAIVGIDSLNIDDITDPQRPVHTLLLGTGIPIAEHLCNLNALPANGSASMRFRSRWRGMRTFPLRAYGELAESSER